MKKWTAQDIKAFRKKYSLTQRQLADLLGVIENYVYFLERGIRTPSKTLRLLLGYVEETLKKGD
jgi:transcriptional regulator with XRE-family HTH domain